MSYKGCELSNEAEIVKTTKGMGAPGGMALIVVLWVLTLLSVLALEFCFTMKTELNITRNYKEKGQLYYYAQGGISRAIAELIYINDQVIHTRRTKPVTAGLENVEKNVEKPEIEKEWRCDGTPYAVSFQSGEAEVKVKSESGRINLNGRRVEPLLKKVAKYFLDAGEQRDIFVDSILDWKDADDLHRINGAENDYYRSLPEPYDCKNADFDTTEELLMVRGVTPEIYYGKKAKSEDGQETPAVGLKDIFTVFSTVDQVDINLAAPEVLMVLFGIPYEVAKKIVEAREETAFKSEADFKNRIPEIGASYAEVASFISYRVQSTPYYSITSLGKMKNSDSKKGLECVVRIDKQEKSGYRVVMWKDVLF